MIFRWQQLLSDAVSQCHVSETVVWKRWSELVRVHPTYCTAILQCHQIGDHQMLTSYCLFFVWAPKAIIYGQLVIKCWTTVEDIDSDQKPMRTPAVWFKHNLRPLFTPTSASVRNKWGDMRVNKFFFNSGVKVSNSTLRWKNWSRYRGDLPKKQQVPEVALLPS